MCRVTRRARVNGGRAPAACGVGPRAGVALRPALLSSRRGRGLRAAGAALLGGPEHEVHLPVTLDDEPPRRRGVRGRVHERTRLVGLRPVGLQQGAVPLGRVPARLGNVRSWPSSPGATVWRKERTCWTSSPGPNSPCRTPWLAARRALPVATSSRTATATTTVLPATATGGVTWAGKERRSMQNQPCRPRGCGVAGPGPVAKSFRRPRGFVCRRLMPSPTRLHAVQPLARRHPEVR